MAENSRAPLKDFEKRWSLWAHQPPRTPSDEAAQQLLTRLPDRIAERRFVTSWRMVLPAAAVLVLALGVGFLWKTDPTTPTASSPVPPSIALDGNTALIWLDPDTPLFLTLSEPEVPRGEGQ